MIKNKKSQEKMSNSGKVATIVAMISAVAGIVIAIINNLQGIQIQPSTPVAVISPVAHEAQLSKANVILTESPDKETQVREWLGDPDNLQYQTMAQTILTALEGKKVINPIPLDVILGKYRVTLGGTESDNFTPDQYKDIEKTKKAMFDTWKERHPNLPQMSFDEIVELAK